MTMRTKISRVNDLEKESLLSVKAEKVEMTLNTSNAMASGLLIQRLTELYENPIEASVRETVSNAIDAVTEMFTGNRPRVEINAPTSLHPVLIIKDNGVGMTYEDLKEIYSKYGSSTKTDNLDTIGAYGLGAKSPLAYGTEFTVTSVKNNQKTTIIVAREEFTNYIKIVNSQETEEPTGTTVSIPVKSRDINQFAEYVNSYKNVPMDKDIELIINGELVEEKFEVLTEDLKIYANDKEEVFGKVWVNTEKALEMLNISDYNLSAHIKYIIGGWAYNTPNGRNRYYNKTESPIYVELKPGIVSFNSARDAITTNDRYIEFEERVFSYIKSNEFENDLIEKVNQLPIDSFKKILARILSEYRRYIEIDEETLKISKLSLNSRTVNLENLVHTSGYNFNEILKNIPKKQVPTIIFQEKKDRHYKTSKNEIMSKHLLNYYQFNGDSITAINKKIDEVLITKEDEGHNLSHLVINIASFLNSDSKSNLKMTIITDIKDSEELKTIKSGRKNIVRIRNNNKDLDAYTSIMVLTKHSKQEMEIMVKDIITEEFDIKIKTADNIIEEIKKYRAINKNNEPRIRQSELETTFYEQGISGRTKATIKDINVKKHNFVVLSKGNISSSKMEMIYAWYCNENKLKPEEVGMYISVGMHTLIDLKILENEFGSEIYRDPSSESAGMSNMYYEKVHNNLAKLNAIRNDSISTSEKAFVRFITGIAGNNPDYIIRNFKTELNHAKEAAKIMGKTVIDLSDKDIEKFENFDTNIFGNIYYSSEWQLDSTALTHISTFMKKKHLDLAKNLLSIASNRSYRIVDNEIITHYEKVNDMLPGLTTLENVYGGDNDNKAYELVTKSAAEAYIKFVNATIKQLQEIKL